MIGVGVGDLEQVTIQAVNALNAVDVFFVFDKENVRADLGAARKEICARYIRGREYRVVEIADPPRDRAAAGYTGAVEAWRDERARVLDAAIEAELPDGGTGGILVWGDPALYDGTIALMESLRAAGRPVEYEVIPGISSVQTLAARHRIPLHRVAGAFTVTTGRRLAATAPADVDDVVVMLDGATGGELACTRFREEPLEIYWGAYLGGADEVLRAGPLDEVIDEINATRRRLREHKGWVMDAYLLRRTP